MTAEPITYTIVVSETSSPFGPIYNRPLIYDLPVSDLGDEAAVLRAAAVQRFTDIEGDFEEGNEFHAMILTEIVEGLRLEFALPHQETLAADWRD